MTDAGCDAKHKYVIAGLDPAIHLLRKTPHVARWVRGSSPPTTGVPALRRPRSNRAIAAVHHHHRSRDVGRQIRRKEHRRAHDVLGLAGAPERGVIDEDLRELRITR